MACKILALGEGARGGKRDISLALTVQRGGKAGVIRPQEVLSFSLKNT